MQHGYFELSIKDTFPDFGHSREMSALKTGFKE
jgi:hypothetical protein